MRGSSKTNALNDLLKKCFSIRFFSLFLIFFGLGGTIIWPITGFYFTTGLDEARSTIELVVEELRNVEQTLNESYSRIEILQESTSDIGFKLSNMLEALNRSSLSLLTLAANVKKTSGLLDQASESMVLRLISEDFAESIKDASKDLEDLSEAFENQNISFNEFLKELSTIENITHFGNQIIDFLKNTIRSFLIVLKFVTQRLNSINNALDNFGLGLFILTLDTTLVHLSLAMIGFIFIRKQSGRT